MIGSWNNQQSDTRVAARLQPHGRQRGRRAMLTVVCCGTARRRGEGSGARVDHDDDDCPIRSEPIDQTVRSPTDGCDQRTERKGEGRGKGKLKGLIDRGAREKWPRGKGTGRGAGGPRRREGGRGNERTQGEWMDDESHKDGAGQIFRADRRAPPPSGCYRNEAAGAMHWAGLG